MKKDEWMERGGEGKGKERVEEEEIVVGKGGTGGGRKRRERETRGGIRWERGSQCGRLRRGEGRMDGPMER